MWIRFDYNSRTGHASSYFTHVQSPWHLKELLDRLGIEFEEMKGIEVDGQPMTLDALRDHFKARRRSYEKPQQVAARRPL